MYRGSPISSSGVAMLGRTNLPSRPSSREVAVACMSEAVIEIASIGEVIVRAGVDADEAQLQRVIRAVRSA